MTQHTETERFQSATRQLRTSRSYFHAIVTRSADGVLVIDEDGVIQYANPAAQSILGRSLETLLGSRFGVPCVPGEPIEIDVVRDDDVTRIAELRVSATHWERRPAFLAMIRDVTENRESEQLARNEVRRRDEFLAMLSHELRNPLATITNATRVAQRTLDTNPDGVGRALGIIDRQCLLVRRLLDDLLDVSRFTCGKIELRSESVLLQRVVADAVETSAEPCERRRHVLEVDMPPEPLFVEGDPARLVQVFVNLLGNAFKYTPTDGAVRVRVRVEEPTDAGCEGAGCEEGTNRNVRIEVRDDGCGIPADRLDAIFEPFVQLDSSIEHGQPGLGMGLALVKMIVDRHGGDVSVHSEGDDLGTTFTVRLPLIEVGCEPPEVEVPTGRPARILVADDNEDLRQMIATLLEIEGHEVKTARNGRETVALAERERFDMAFVDIGMPGIDGYEAARRIRRRTELDGLRLVALTGYGLPDDVRRAEEAGFDHHLVKPVELDDLNEIIELGPRVHA